jgi:hypothetical protein
VTKEWGFVVGLIIGFACAVGACLEIAIDIGMPRWSAPPSLLEYYVAEYRGIGVDYDVALRGMFGTGDRLRNADLILTSSSKGLFGYRASIIHDELAAQGHDVNIVNLAFGHGEGLGVVAEILERQSIAHSMLVIDLNENSGNYQFSPSARGALEADWLSAYRLVLSTWARYLWDWFIGPLIPRWSWNDGHGHFEPRFLGAQYRAWNTNDLLRDDRSGLYACATGTPRSWAFDRDGMIREHVLGPADARDIRVIATAIPYRGAPWETPIYDPFWAARSAQEASLPFTSVAYAGLVTIDGGHLDLRSAEEFSRRFAASLLTSVPRFGEWLKANQLAR